MSRWLERPELVQLRGEVTQVSGAVQALHAYTSEVFTGLAAAGKQPPDVADIRALIGDVLQVAPRLQDLTDSFTAFLLSPGWEQRLPQLLEVLDRAEKRSEDPVKCTLARTLFLGLIFLAAFLVSILITGFIFILYIDRRFSGLSTRPSSANSPGH